MAATPEFSQQPMIADSKSDSVPSRKRKPAPASKLDVPRLGQVFTPDTIVSQMLELRANKGTVLEPSAGDGAFLNRLGSSAVGIEIDSTLDNSGAEIMDFFDYPFSNMFDTIIGNPPYVRYRDIPSTTKTKLRRYGLDRRANLYLFFIAKCLRHLNPGGELIFITPRDFLKSTSARHLNEKLYRDGSMTHYYELGDARIFDGFSPNCAIWRWQQGLTKRKMETGGVFNVNLGQITFSGDTERRLGHSFDVKVGGVSGADKIFANDMEGNLDFVCSRTARTGELRRMIYNLQCDYLLPYKDILMSRKIRNFDETNWWEWGRDFCHRKGPRVYVNSKTRIQEPFFASNQEAYDGSVLALFPRILDVHEAADKLNAVDWEKLGFVCDGRYIFSQRSLYNAPIEL